MSDSIKAIFLNEYGDYEYTQMLSEATPSFLRTELHRPIPAYSLEGTQVPHTIPTNLVLYRLQGRVYDSQRSGPLSYVYVKQI